MQAKQFDLIVFDWDGTLMDSAALIVSAIQNACRDLALPVPSDHDARYIIGLGLDDSMRYLLPGLTRDRYAAVAERYRHHFVTRDHETTLFEGVRETLDELLAAGRRLAVATGKSRSGLDRVLKHSGLSEIFHATRCADESFPKPHPAMLEDVMATLGVDKERTLMIGDTSHDLRMAASAGVAAVAVSYGAHGKEELLRHDALAYVDTVAELRQWLMSAG
jgi:phosphoglycolate phosphatase